MNSFNLYNLYLDCWSTSRSSIFYQLYFIIYIVLIKYPRDASHSYVYSHISDYENIFLQILQIILEPFIYMWLCIICGTSSEKKICIKWFLVSLFAFKIARSFISWIWYWILLNENEDSYFHFSHDTLLIVNWSMRSWCSISCYTWNIILQNVLL